MRFSFYIDTLNPREGGFKCKKIIMIYKVKVRFKCK